MEIRRLGTGDVAALRSAVLDLLQEESDSDSPASPVHLEGALADPSCYFFVCLVGERPVGYLSAYRFPAVDHDGFKVYLYDMTVHPDYRQRGFGTALVTALKREASREDVTEIWVGTSVMNTAAQRTFESTGAERDSDTYIEYIYELDD